ncbi:hypothetical protein COJ23_22275 [Priestia megaterium]|uniref:hypothetical protein n=1 Tax=Priestia megaterium TaxID=1404 RepID=UPI000BF3085A|nr:hypothetical protein [Priestia megaterium]PFK46732.1 hypothetical protein COJ23_22275 [Priestia megaterium]
MSDNKISKNEDLENDLNLFIIQYAMCYEFICHYFSYKELVANSEELNGDFWTYTKNTHILQCFILWCNVFGSDGENNHTHWKHLSVNHANGGFKAKLLKEINMTEKEWHSTWKNIKDFRDSYVAHRDKEFNMAIPYFENAYKSILIYDKWMQYEAFEGTGVVSGIWDLKDVAAEKKQKIHQDINKWLDR